MDLSIRPVDSLAVFDPLRVKTNDAKADALIDYAKKVKDWPLLVEAVDRKIEDQAEFVGWWDVKVSPNRGGDRKSENQKLRSEFLIPLSEAEKQTEISQQQVSRWRTRLVDRDRYRDMLFGSTYHVAMAEEGTPDTTALKWTGDPESYTPKPYIEAAREVMGAIDLDPASNAIAQKTVGALEWYDEKSDGLVRDWRGRVFLNPPYKYPLVAQFIDKLCDEYNVGRISAAILLTNNNTDTRWWHRAVELASGVCFTAGRINFYKADGQITQPTNGQNFFYFGRETESFRRVFSLFGIIMTSLREAP